MAFPPSVMRTSRCNGVQQYLGTIIHERYSHRPISIRDLGNATTRYREHVAQHFTIGVWLGGYVTLTFQNYLTETSLLSWTPLAYWPSVDCWLRSALSACNCTQRKDPRRWSKLRTCQCTYLKALFLFCGNGLFPTLLYANYVIAPSTNCLLVSQIPQERA